jgi:hypothetical protein
VIFQDELFPEGMDAGEVYDILVLCLLKAINRWDPYYVDKVRQVVEIINGSNLLRYKQFSAFQISSECAFDATGVCRVLARRGYLEKVFDTRRPASCQ